MEKAAVSLLFPRLHCRSPTVVEGKSSGGSRSPHSSRWGKRGEVDVPGWVNKNNRGAEGSMIERYSDHSLLYLGVLKV